MRKIFFLSLFLSCLAASLPAFASRQDISILEASSSGKTVRINAGTGAGLRQNDAVLIRTESKKLAAARVLQASGDMAVLRIVEDYNGEPLEVGGAYTLVYGEAYDNAPNLPDYVSSRDEEAENPSNERFFTKDGRELEHESPDLEDEKYSPEVVARPEFPRPPEIFPHNLTIGVASFRNRDLGGIDRTPQDLGVYTSYYGYAVRYAYAFASNYWLRTRRRAIFATEVGLGTYTFDYTFKDNTTAAVKVFPISFTGRYLIPLSDLFRFYPYIGYENNIVTVSSNTTHSLDSLRGGRLMAGGGVVLNLPRLDLAKDQDLRFEFGTDGFLAGLVFKF